MSADRKDPDDVTATSSSADETQQLDTTQQLEPTQQLDTTQQLATTQPLDPHRTLTLEDLMDTDRADTTSAATSPADRAPGDTGATTPGEPGLPAAPAPAPRRGVRVGTVVWGLVIAAVGVGLLAYASGVVFDVQLALIILIAAAGLALLTGSLVSGMRRRGR